MLDAILRGGNLVCQPPQLFRFQHPVINQPYQQLLHRSTAETIDQLLCRLYRNIAPCVRSAVNEGTPVNFMRDVALLFQFSEDGANRRIFEAALTGQPFAAHVRGAIGMRPHVVQNELLQRSGRLAAVTVKHYNVNICSTGVGACQAPAVDVLYTKNEGELKRNRRQLAWLLIPEAAFGLGVKPVAGPIQPQIF